MVVVLYILLGILGFVMLLLMVGYLLRPHLLILPYSAFTSLLVKNPPFVDLERNFPEHQKLEDNWLKIREELLEILKMDGSIPKFHEVDSIQRLISAKDDIPWRTYGLRAFNDWLPENCSRAPFTTALLKELPNVTLAMFSILDAGKRIPPHFGFNKMVYRYHLALIVPTDGDCWIRVGSERYRWKEGQGVLFDDTYVHEVWNNTTQRRVVLFLDVTRDHDFPKWLLPVNRWMYGLLANSEKVKGSVRRGEIPRDIQPQS
jgi:ornithine lipid ester-linked acyl 2-hydroxylase